MTSVLVTGGLLEEHASRLALTVLALLSTVSPKDKDC